MNANKFFGGIIVALLIAWAISINGGGGIISGPIGPIPTVTIAETSPAAAVKWPPGVRDVLTATDADSVRAYRISHAPKDSGGAPIYRDLDIDNTDLSEDDPAIQKLAAGTPAFPYVIRALSVDGKVYESEIVDREQSLRFLKKYGGP